ncbi:hypothetical protein CCMSSC00406_0005630 [Pleurotus cornucopiae]|uniref:Uncharacterized protein n=1 Tax=Pleurotus cornucopiae TaxID=5321 RepID=A0ACB7IU45_PLECO|nr:hypothetical protein CCMSSC00406_0005630 [Pleurotus cornucopiae]
MASYKLLPVSPVPNDDEDLPPRKPSMLTPRICLLACILCTVFNLILSFRFETAKSNAYPIVTYKDIQSLRRPSQFIRFDEIKRPSPPVHKEFNNYPILMTQVDAAQKDKVFEDDVKRYMTTIGTISPRDRRVLITDTISTVVQFRAIDYGMERCELHLALPSLDSALLSGNQTMALSVHRLNTTIPLDVSTLSHTSKPIRMTKVGDVHLSSKLGEVWQRSFSCKTEEVLSFELTCSPETTTKGCHIEWWQNMKKPNPGTLHFVHRA